MSKDEADEGLYSNVPKTVLRPRHPGESIKVAQVVLKRRDRNLKHAAERAAKLAQIKQAKSKRRLPKEVEKLNRLEKLVAESLSRKNDRGRLIRMHRRKTLLTKRQKPEKESQVVMVFRNGARGGAKRSKESLQHLRMEERYTGIFVVSSTANYEHLWKAKPFVYWGQPSFKTVFNILHKKAQFRPPDAPEEKILLSDNNIIEQHLGDLGIICTEDLVDIIYNNGPNFDKVMERLWPFSLGDDQKARSMISEKLWRSGPMTPEQINEVVETMLGE